MDIKRFSEHFLCDAMRLAILLGGENATLSDGIGNSSDFPLVPKERDQVGEDIRFIRVEGEEYYEIAYVTNEQPTQWDSKIRNKSYYRVLVGREIHDARLSVGMTLSELSRKTNLREHSIQRIEEGRWDMDMAMLGLILDALNKTIKII